MAGLNDDLDKARKKIEELKNQLENLTKKKVTIVDSNTINNLTQAEEALNLLNSTISETIRKQAELEEGFGGIFEELSGIVGEMSKMNSSTKMAEKGFKGIQSLAQQLKYDQQGLTNLSEKELKSIQQKLRQKQQEVIDQSKIIQQQYKSIALDNQGNAVSEKTLQNRLKSLGISKNEFSNMKAINTAAEGNFSVFNDINDQLEKRIEFEKESNKLAGTSQGILQGIDSGMNKLGFGGLASKLGFGEAAEKMKETSDKITTANQNLSKQKDIQSQIDALNTKGLSDKQIQAGFGGTELKNLLAAKNAIGSTAEAASGMGAAMKILGQGAKVLGQNLAASLSPANLIVRAIIQLIEAITKTDKEAGELAKSMNMTYSEALGVRRELGNMAAMSGDAAVNTKGLQESYMAIGKSLGSNAIASEKTLITFTKLREQAGYTNEQLASLNKLSLVNGKSLEDNTKEILGGAQAYASRRGLVINEKEVLNDVVNASASLKLSLGGSADALAKAAVQTRAVGLNLEQAAAMADSLLQFESSIENELSAELLLGKDLNFEKARQLALNNDIAGAAEEIAKQVGTSADFAKMNAIQQESIAKAAGLTKEQLAQSLMDREALAKLSGVEGADAKEKFNNLVKQVGMEEAKKRLGNEQLANQYAQQSVQERFTQAVEKLQEIFVQIAEPILAIVSPLMDLVTAVLPAINFLLQPIIGAFQVIASIVKGVIQLLTLDFKGAMKSFGEVPQGLKTMVWMGGEKSPSTADDIIIPSLTSPFSHLTFMNDGYSLPKSKPGYGKRTILQPEGAIQLNDKDTLIAGTDLFKNPEKANDIYSGPLSVANSSTPKKESPSNPNDGVIAGIKDLIAITGKVNAVPTLKMQ